MSRTRPPPRFRDWALLGTSAVFVAAGFAALRDDPRTAIVTIAFFGSCMAVFLWQIHTTLRARAFAADAVIVPAGVPIRPRRRLIVVMGIWLLGLGAVLGLVDISAPVAFRLIGALIALIGLGLLIGAALGWLPRSAWLRFDPDGLTVGQRDWQMLIPWDRISDVIETDLQGQPMLLIGVLSVYTLPVSPADAAPRAHTSLASNDRWAGAPIAILTDHYGVDLPVLSLAITTSIANAGAQLTHRLPG